MDKNSKIYVAGHKGLVGSAIVEQLRDEGYTNIICRSHSELDLTNRNDVRDFFAAEKPEYVFLAAARVGGIGAMNVQQVEFLNGNLRIQSNVFEASHDQQVKKMVFISSAVIYPVNASQPIVEESLLSRAIERACEGYSIAKITGIKQCSFYKKEYGDDFVAVVPANIYGYNAIYDIKRSNVIPAMIRRFHSAKVHRLKSATIWGTGNARRELIFSRDAASGCIFIMQSKTDCDYYNLGCNKDYSMLEIAEAVRRAVGYTGEILTDPSKPEGAARRLLDSSRINSLGWSYQTPLDDGLRLAYEWFLENVKDKDELYI
ncbi:MAG: GDP-L-fucose synthase [Oscillospiraceae bacterium]|nr:GDP-L-fucose synthase [Oscillospiraceae bacterium]